MKPIMTTDPETGATYLRVSDHPVADTVEVHPCVIIDLDISEKVAGIEYLPPVV